MPVIWVKNGPLKGKTFDLLDSAITIGRDSSETIQIIDQGVSRQHAEILRAGEMCFIRDFQSTNGTFVNDQRVAEELLRSGDQIRIGSTVLVFEDRGAPPVPPPREVEYAGAEGDLVGLNTVEMPVDRESASRIQPIGREVSSRNLEVLYDLARLAAAEKDLHAFHAKAVEQIATSVRAEHGYVFMIDRASGKLTPRGSFAAGPQVERKVSRAIVRQVMQSGRSVLTSDATADSRFALDENVVLRRIRSVVAAPILAEARPVGLLYLHTDRSDQPFRQEDLELATAAAIQLGLAAAGFAAAQRARQATHGLVKALVTAAELKTPDRQGHSERVAQCATAIAIQMGLSRPDVQRVQLAALLHDIGKLATPPEPPPGIDRDAWRGEHVLAGERIVGAIPGFEDILPAIRYHHERADGGGFPFGKKNDEVPVHARILIVANAFDLMGAGGAEGHSIPVKEVLVHLGRNARTLYDEKAVEALHVAHRNNTLNQPIDLFGD